MPNSKKFLQIIFGFIPFIFVFISSLFTPLDPDLGWHLKYGEYFFKYHQILRDNTFSTLMSNYHWANGSWGTDIILYLLYSHGYFLALTITGALVITFTFYLFSKASGFTTLKELIFFPIFVYLLYPLNKLSLRGEVISLLFLGILFYILKKYQKNENILFVTPILFLIWCNVHEEGFLGLAIFGLWAFLETIRTVLNQDKKEIKKNIKKIVFPICVFIISFFMTYINPFGSRLVLFSLSHFGNPTLLSVNEYIPFVMWSYAWWAEAVFTLIVFVGVVYLVYTKRLKQFLPIICLIIIFLFLPFFVKRYVWVLYYLSFLFVGILVDINLKRNIQQKLEIFTVIFFALCFVYVIRVKIFSSTIFNLTWQTYCLAQEVPCSSSSAKYILDHYKNSKLFSYYDWGGWLIWNYPSLKPEIDGRMLVWSDNDGYSAVKEYADYQNGKKLIDASTYDVVLVPLDKSPLYFELEELMQQGKWKLVYEDNYAGVVVRNEDQRDKN